jgi:deoxyribodipyrimidine photo-lyase
MTTTRGLYWVTNDLRLDDNPTLLLAAASVDELVVAYAPPRAWLSSEWLDKAASPMRWQFLHDSLQDFQLGLSERGQKLQVALVPAEQALADWIAQWRPTRVFAAVQAGWYERTLWQETAAQHPGIDFTAVHANTLFEQDMLPFQCNAEHLPRTFSAFRRKAEALDVPLAVGAVHGLPPPPADVSAIASDQLAQLAPKVSGAGDPAFHGGESAAQLHLDHYFSGQAPHQYKTVRNALDGWENSTKFSGWLALGCLSARRVVARLREFESHAGASESSYWIFFELLWREYFQWYAHAHGARLFSLSGIQAQLPVNSQDPDRLAQWQQGTTAYPVVNACMNQLRATGYMSNRGRQLAASCFVNELGMDWRLGAAWFEHHLLDYDVASNWGNWQYLAGVGADPRGKRRFDLQKQAVTYDPAGSFTGRWC